jgi:hypothetical protein
MGYDKVVFRVHAIERMFERDISEADVRDVLGNGEVIQTYPDDLPFPSRLMLGYCGGRPLHVVAGDDPEETATVVITVYQPDPGRWDATFRRRK